MKKFKKILAVTLASAMMLTSMSGCGKNAVDQGEVVAVINGVEVPESLYRTYLWSTQQFFEQISGPVIWEMDLEGQSTIELAKERALESAVLSVVTEEKAKELGIELTKDEVKAIKADAENFAKERKDVLETYKFGEKDVEQVLIATELSAKVQDKMMESYMPSQEDIDAYIKENKADYEQVTAKHILISTQDENRNELPEETIKEKRVLAEELLQRALAGEDIAELAKEYSEDPGSKDKGGEYTFAKGEMVPEFEKAAFEGKAGEVWPELVETMFGYHIVKTEKHLPADEEKMKEDFINSEKMLFINGELEAMIKNAKIEKQPIYETIQIIRPETEEAPTDETTDEADSKEKDDKAN